MPELMELKDGHRVRCLWLRETRMNQTENNYCWKQKSEKIFPVDKKINGQKAEVKAVNDVSITIHSNEVYGLVGETGCGKSTLGRTLLRLMEATSGQILYKGQDITTIPQKEFRRYRQNLQMIFKIHMQV